MMGERRTLGPWALVCVARPVLPKSSPSAARPVRLHASFPAAFPAALPQWCLAVGLLW